MFTNTAEKIYLILTLNVYNINDGQGNVSGRTGSLGPLSLGRVFKMHKGEYIFTVASLRGPCRTNGFKLSF